MPRGILDTIGLAAALVFAIPIAVAGAGFLRQGDTVAGVALLGVAVAMVLIKRYITTPGDIPGTIAGKVVGTVVEEPDPDENEG
jgi:hypothetical protein